jgi:hypothetical protein
MKPKNITDLGLSDEEMHRMLHGARVAFGPPDEYNNTPTPTFEAPRQPPPQKGKVKHVALRR